MYRFLFLLPLLLLSCSVRSNRVERNIPSNITIKQTFETKLGWVEIFIDHDTNLICYMAYASAGSPGIFCHPLPEKK